MDGGLNIKLKRLAVLIRKLASLFYLKLNERISKQFFMFVFFVFLSTFIWLIKTLNKDNFETVIQYPVRYVNFPSDKVLVGDLPNYLNIKINGTGKALLGYKIRPKIKGVNFDVNSFSLNRLNDNSDEFYTLTKYAQENLTDSYFKRGVEIIDIKPDTLKFLFSDKSSKKLEVKSLVTYTTKNGYMINSHVLVSPDSVTVYGPESVLDSIDYVETEIKEYTQLDDTIQDKVPIRYYKYLSFSQTRVKVTVPIDAFTSSSVEIPIEVRNVPDSISIKIFPSQVKVSYQVAMSKYESVTSNNFKAIVDFEQSKDILTTRLRIQLEVKDPSLVLNPVLIKNRVEFLIEN